MAEEMENLGGLFGDREARQRRKRARKSGGGGIGGTCKTGKVCPIPSKTQKIRGKVKYKKIEEPDSPTPRVQSRINPRDMHTEATPDQPQKESFLKKVFGGKKKSYATFK